MGTCEMCRAYGPVADVSYRQNTGLFFVRWSKHIESRLCRSCSVRCFQNTTAHNLFFGWWGVISLFVTPVFILGNVASLIETLRMPSRRGERRARLEEHRVYAMNLLEVKDPAIVIEVLQKDTRLPVAEVEAFVRSLQQSMTSRPPGT